MSPQERQPSIHKFGGPVFRNGGSGHEICENILSSELQRAPTKGGEGGGGGVLLGAVVSALPGITDLLGEAVERAGAGDPLYLELVREVGERHRAVLHHLLPPSSEEEALVFAELEDLRTILLSLFLTGRRDQELLEAIGAYGELWNTRILAAHLRRQWSEKPVEVVFLDSREVLFVERDDFFETPKVNWKMTTAAFGKFLGSLQANAAPKVLVITGYIARTAAGNITTTLKRKGSDFSASIFASLLEASRITLWSEMDGFFSADPSLVPSASLIPELTYEEVSELSFYGPHMAVHPRTMLPAARAGIPIFVRNAFNLASPGTKIHADLPEPAQTQVSPRNAVRALLLKQSISLITIYGAQITIGEYSPLENRGQLMTRLRKEGIEVFVVLYSSPENSLTFAVPEKLDQVAKLCAEEHFSQPIKGGEIKSVQVHRGFAILTAVGKYISQVPGVASVFFSALQRRNLNVEAIAQNGERTISVVISMQDAEGALRCVHASFKHPPGTLVVGIIGADNWELSSRLLERILRHEGSPRGARIHIAGIATSSGMVLRPDLRETLLSARSEGGGAVPPSLLKELLASQASAPLDLERFTSHIQGEAGGRAAIVDCCDSSRDNARGYVRWLSSGLDVVTANLAPFAFDVDFLEAIAGAEGRYETRFLYDEGLAKSVPLRSLLEGLAADGTSVTMVEGVFCPQLNQLLTRFSTSSEPFGELLGSASHEVRRLCSGELLARRLCALARASQLGRPAFLDVDVKRLVPRSIHWGDKGSVQSASPLWQALDSRRDAAAAKGELLRYVGTFEASGHGRLQLQSYPASHPFGTLKEDEMVLIFHTSSGAPLVIRAQEPAPEGGTNLFENLKCLLEL